MSDNSLSQVLTQECFKIIISRPRQKNEKYKKITLTSAKNGYAVEMLTEKQAFHERIDFAELCSYCEALLKEQYSQLNAWDGSYEYNVLSNKKGNLTVKKSLLKQVAVAYDTHNREKSYIIPEGTIVAPLVDMGIFTVEGRVVKSMYDKFKQINRFIEIIDDAVDMGTKSINVIDFGCGKSYLTFILYYYLTELRGIDTQITGLDLKADVIEKCNNAAKKYGYKGLRFEVGDIKGYTPKHEVDMVISLHACDTATDHALYNAVCWGAKMIFSVPCCQHELNGQLKPKNLELFSRYGLIAERFSALATDAIRANLLTASGYKTQVLEFVDLSHTPKNLLLRAVKCTQTKKTKELALAQARAVMNEFNFTPCLYELMSK